MQVEKAPKQGATKIHNSLLLSRSFYAVHCRLKSRKPKTQRFSNRQLLCKQSVWIRKVIPRQKFGDIVHGQLSSQIAFFFEEASREKRDCDYCRVARFNLLSVLICNNFWNLQQQKTNRKALLTRRHGTNFKQKFLPIRAANKLDFNGPILNMLAGYFDLTHTCFFNLYSEADWSMKKTATTDEEVIGVFGLKFLLRMSLRFFVTGVYYFSTNSQVLKTPFIIWMALVWVLKKSLEKCVT